jgi:type I restriction enzyme R subunit
LRKIFEEFANNWKKIYEELEKLRQRIVNAGKEPTYGLHRKKQMPIYRMLKREIYGEEPVAKIAMAAEDETAYRSNEEEKIGRLVALTKELYGEIERELKLIGFWESIPARNKLVADLQKAMLQPEFEKMPGLVKNRKHIISRLMEIAEKNHDTILYAN